MLADDEELAAMMSFAMRSVERWTDKDKATGRPRDNYAVNVERFRLACDLFMVPREKMLEAYDVATLVAKAATEAPDALYLAERNALIRSRGDD